MKCSNTSQDDRKSAEEMVRSLKSGGRIALFVPNRGYPFETHGIFWRGQLPLWEYSPGQLSAARAEDRLGPHVRVYSQTDLSKLFEVLPVVVIHKTIIFGAYDNIIARNPLLGKSLRSVLQFLEKTPFRWFGLSHFWVIEKVGGNEPSLT